MILIDAVADWFQQNSPGFIVGLLFWIMILTVLARYVERQNNPPR